MKVFLSWSGDLSHQIALVLRDWLPSVIQNLDPYVSSEDIDKGARWSSDVSQELEASNFGILCVTRDNLNAPWLNFEAGALSKSLDKSKVSPFLLGIKRSEVKGPILQFQSTVYEREDIKKLIFTINRSETIPFVEEGRLTKAFDVWWPQLQESMDVLQEQSEKLTSNVDTNPTTSNNEILEEILELARSQQKILTDSTNIATELSTDNQLRTIVREELIPTTLKLGSTISHIRNICENNSIDEPNRLQLIKDLLNNTDLHPQLIITLNAHSEFSREDLHVKTLIQLLKNIQRKK